MTTSLPGQHATPDVLADYAAGRLSAEQDDFVEDHLIHCLTCRGRVSAVAAFDGARLATVWDNVTDALDQPRPSTVETALRLVGASRETARLVAAARSLRVPWLSAMVICLFLALGAAAADALRASWIFLTLAPLVPVAGVVAAYGPQTDPAWELARASQYPLSKLLLLRIAAVLASTLPVAALVGVLLPNTRWWLGAVWLLPALAFVTLTLWAASFVAPMLAAGVLSVGWFAVTTTAAVHRSNPEVLLRPVVQLAFLAVLATACVGVWSRRDEFATPRWQA